MLLLPTEKLLLERLSKETGLVLGDRIYGWDILAMSTMQDELAGTQDPFSIAYHQERVEAFRKMTQYQKLVASDAIIPFFTRSTENLREEEISGKPSVDYSVESKELYSRLRAGESFCEETDAIISGCLLDRECIIVESVSLPGEPSSFGGIVFIESSLREGVVNSVDFELYQINIREFLEGSETYLEERGLYERYRAFAEEHPHIPHFDAILDKFRQYANGLKGHRYDPEILADLVSSTVKLIQDYQQTS